MTIQYASDLHLEFPENRKFMEAFPLLPAADVLILAGDIIPFARMDKYAAFFDYLNANWEQVFWIPGNHEYYRSDINKRSGIFKERIRERVFLLNQQIQIYGDLRIIFSTLWSKISSTNALIIQNRLNDFQVIKDGDAALSIEKYNKMHLNSIQMFKAFFNMEHTGKTIVVTHHVPTLTHYPEEYEGDALNEGFATELYDLIEKHQPEAWIFGHHHVNVPEFKIGKTRLLTNQLGYVGYGENTGFQRDKVLSL